MESECTQILVLMQIEVEWVLSVTAGPYVAVVVVQGFLFDVLVFARDHSVSGINILSCLLECHWFDQTAKLVVKVT